MTSVLSPSIQEPTSAQSTPGLEFPGAFPREHTATTRPPPPSDSRRTSERPQPVSLPSSEKEGTHPGEHCGGVGPLPGNISETSVAKLPDERATEGKPASAPAPRSKEVFADTDRRDDSREAVATAVPPANPLAAPFAAPFVIKLPDERASKGEATPESASRSKELAANTDRGDDPSEVVSTAVSPTSLPPAPAVDPTGPFASKISEERVSKDEVTPESASRSKMLAADTDRGEDSREAVPTAVSPTSLPPAPAVDPTGPFASKVSEERVSKDEATPESASRSKMLAEDTDRGEDSREAVPTAVSPTSLPPAPDVIPAGPSAAKVPEERMSEGKVTSESASRSKELAADTGRGGDTRESVPAAAGSFGTPDITDQDSPVRKTDSQDAVGGQVPETQRTESSGTADVTTPADSKFKEELRKEETSGGVFEEGLHSPQQPPQRPPPPPSHVSAAGDLAMPKGAEEDPNKAAPAQQQPEIVGDPAGPRKGRSSSDSDASNHGKASVMNRVKGEVKVLFGKASGNKEKVDAGQRMKQGTQ